MRLHRAYVFVSRQFSNRCGSSGATKYNGSSICVYCNPCDFFLNVTWLEARKNRKMVAVVRGRRSQPRYFQKAKIYEKEFKCCFGMGGRAINAEDVFVKDVEGL